MHSRECPTRRLPMTEPDPDPLVTHLRELEEQLARPEVRSDPELLSKLLADDFREFGGSGRVFSKAQIIAALQSQPPLRIWLEEFHAISLAPDLALVTYRGNCQFHNSDTVLRSLRSSVWRFRDGRWQILFHQGTPTSDAGIR